MHGWMDGWAHEINPSQLVRTDHSIPHLLKSTPSSLSRQSQVLLPFRLDSPPKPIRKQRFKVLPEHPRRERDERARSRFVEGEVFGFDGLKDIHSHRAHVYAQEGGDGGGFHGAVLPEVVGAEVGSVRL